MNNHFEQCRLRDKMIRVYRLKGERTEQEWEEFIASPESDDTNEEVALEEEYLEWKNSKG